MGNAESVSSREENADEVERGGVWSTTRVSNSEQLGTVQVGTEVGEDLFEEGSDWDKYSYTDDDVFDDMGHGSETDWDQLFSPSYTKILETLEYRKAVTPDITSDDHKLYSNGQSPSNFSRPNDRDLRSSNQRNRPPRKSRGDPSSSVIANSPPEASDDRRRVSRGKQPDPGRVNQPAGSSEAQKQVKVIGAGDGLISVDDPTQPHALSVATLPPPSRKTGERTSPVTGGGMDPIVLDLSEEEQAKVSKPIGCCRKFINCLEDNRNITGSESTRQKIKENNENQADAMPVLKRILNIIFVTTGMSLFVAVVIVIIYTSIGYMDPLSSVMNINDYDEQPATEDKIEDPLPEENDILDINIVDLSHGQNYSNEEPGLTDGTYQDLNPAKYANSHPKDQANELKDQHLIIDKQTNEKESQESVVDKMHPSSEPFNGNEDNGVPYFSYVDEYDYDYDEYGYGDNPNRFELNKISIDYQSLNQKKPQINSDHLRHQPIRKRQHRKSKRHRT